MESVTIIGAGLCGSLLGARLAQLGYEVDIYERRPDMRKVNVDGGRSINLALSNRGFSGLNLIGVEEKVRELCIPMYGRMIHTLDGQLKLLPYSGRPGLYINSVSRGGLNSLLLEELEKYSNAKLHFGHRCDAVDLDQKRITFYEEEDKLKLDVNFDYVFGTDGAGSALRQAMMTKTNLIRFDFSLKYLTHGYKELEIPSGGSGSFLMEKNALHIWPRGSQMVIALPNLDGSFTVTLFQQFDGDEGLDMLDSDPELALKFFKKYYPDALELMPEFEKSFRENPSSSLATIKCAPWDYDNYSLLLGDAAHAVVPFYGQGMNCAFEDVYILDQILANNKGDIGQTINETAISRKPNSDAIADLAVDNFYEMRDHTGDPVFQLKNAIESILEKQFDSYASKYSMVTFRSDLPYRTAMIKGRLQDEYLMDFSRKVKTVDGLNYEKLKADIDQFVSDNMQKHQL